MRTVLVVDDSAPLRAVLSTSLKMGGYRVLEAASGQQALALLDEQADVDLILTDLNMPVMSGFTFVRSARSRANCKTTPILLLTVESGGDHKEKAKAVGANGWITKPIDSAQLLATIARVLG